MKWLIASDLHGSVPACAGLAAAFHREGADRMLLLGDILNHGSVRDAVRVAEMLSPLADAIIAVRGNCDTDGDLERLPFPAWETCRVFPTGRDPFFFATHGHIYDSAHPPDGMQPGDVLLHGHTHVPMTENHGRFLCFNPGSVGRPRWGSEAGYMTLEDGVFLWKTLSGEEYRRYEL